MATEQQPLNAITLPGARFYGTRLRTSAQDMLADIKKKTFNLIKH